MTNLIPAVNDFIEDTCVLAVIAYVPARGRMLALLSSERRSRQDALLLGVLMGLAGMTEIIFPGARSPYVAHTLLVTFAALLGGLPIALPAVGTILMGATLLRGLAAMMTAALPLTAAALVGTALGRLIPLRYSLARGFAAGLCAQAVVVLLHSTRLAGLPALAHPSHALLSIPANGFGVLLLQFILNDAQARAAGERRRLEVEQANALVSEAQLAALQARIHPHFLFNALTSIASLCGSAPERAEAAVLRLSQLMRRALEANPAAPLCLAEEIEYVRGYLEIEQHRLGSRLRIVWEIEPAAEQVLVPAFSLQTLVENAVSHGIAPKMGAGTVRIVARVRPYYTLIAVLDDGVGFEMRREGVPTAGRDREHGLQIAARQLGLLTGRSRRLRLFSRIDVGTTAAFAVSNGTLPLRKERIGHADRTDRGR